MSIKTKGVRDGYLLNRKYRIHKLVVPCHTMFYQKRKMASSNIDFDGGLAYAFSSVKQEGLTLMAEQTQALKLLSEGRDVIVWFPKGMESLSATSCYPFLVDYKLGRTNAPLIDRKVVLAVFPLVSLMIDQVRSLKSRSVSAAILRRNRGIDKVFVTTPTEVSLGNIACRTLLPRLLSKTTVGGGCF